METNNQDNGSLSFLNIPPDPRAKQFNCDTVKQQNLINREFWVVDYFDGMKTKFGENRVLVKIKYNLADADGDARKFFTNSSEIRYVLEQIRQRNAFPRRVTMRMNGNRYFFE